MFRGAPSLLSGERAPTVFFDVDASLWARFAVTPATVKRLPGGCGYGIDCWREGELRSVALDESDDHEDLLR